jgi:hypothetical protein
MRLTLFIILFFQFFSLLAYSGDMPHLGPVGTRFNHKEILKVEKKINQQLLKKSLSGKITPEFLELEDLQIILRAGKRAILWFEKINSARDSQHKLDLSVKGSSKGIPINDPLKTNTKIVTDHFNQLMNETNSFLSSVIGSTIELPNYTGVNDLEFVKTIRSFDILYQQTIRWSIARENLSWYINRSLWDVRGHLFLKATEDLQKKLSNWSSLSDLEKYNFKIWLMELCHNGDFDVAECNETLSRAIKRGNAYTFYQRVISFGEEMYQSFFQVSSTRIRPEIYWNQNKSTLVSPFLLPPRLDVKNWLVENVEDEWKNDNFNLHLKFIEVSENLIPHIEFESGVSAHVDRVGGDTITIDADHSINNFNQRWSIRHEYGHILGFPDCYLEFYDVKEEAMIYYEIDTDNVMCSRHGHVQNEHILKLQTVYK